MIGRFLIIVATCVFFTAFNSAYAINAGASAGLYLPSTSKYKLGYGVNAYVDYNLISIVDLRVQASYYTAKSDGKEYFDKHYKEDSTLYIYGGSALIKVNIPIPLPILHAYAAAGWGLYETRIKPEDSSAKTKFTNGPVLQAGASLRVWVLDVGLAASYFMNKSDGEQYGGYSAGLSVGLHFD